MEVFNKGYSIGFKKSIIEDYIKSKGISKTTIYKWIKQDDIKDDVISFIDITSSLVNNTSNLTIFINDINIEINDNYNEALLLNVIRTLNKLCLI